VSLSPEQHDELSRLLAEELRAAWCAAAARGATPETLAEMVESRRRALASSLDDPYDRRDDPVERPGVGEQR
jgi:hypothetical protein